MAFKIGNYTIETQEVYNALIQANVTDNENLAKIDKNNDKVISEDELVEVMVEDSDSTGQKKDTTTNSNNTGTTTEDKIAQYEKKIETYQDQAIRLQTQLDELRQKRIKIYNKLSKAGDIEKYNSIMSDASSVKSQMSSIRTQIYQCYYNIESTQSMLDQVKESAAALENANAGNTTAGSANASTLDTTTAAGSTGANANTAQFADNFNKSSFSKGVLAGQGTMVANAAQKYGIDPNLLASIMALETGWGTSNAIKNYNNPGGMMDPATGSMTLIRYSSLQEGVEAVARNLKNNYIDKGLTTISDIGAKYCPVGAANDPNGTNGGWVPSVTTIYNQLTGLKITSTTKIA